MKKKIILSAVLSLIFSISSGSIASSSADTGVRGDINGDMKLTFADYAAFSKYYVGRVMLPDSAIAKADLDENGIINIADAVLLKSSIMEGE